LNTDLPQANAETAIVGLLRTTWSISKYWWCKTTDRDEWIRYLKC